MYILDQLHLNLQRLELKHKVNFKLKIILLKLEIIQVSWRHGLSFQATAFVIARSLKLDEEQPEK